jgi:hypothetical protein
MDAQQHILRDLSFEHHICNDQTVLLNVSGGDGGPGGVDKDGQQAFADEVDAVRADITLLMLDSSSPDDAEASSNSTVVMEIMEESRLFYSSVIRRGAGFGEVEGAAGRDEEGYT